MTQPPQNPPGEAQTITVRPSAEPVAHNPCCAAHGKALTCADYRRSHHVEIRPCCIVDAARLAGEATTPTHVAITDGPLIGERGRLLGLAPDFEGNAHVRVQIDHTVTGEYAPRADHVRPVDPTDTEQAMCDAVVAGHIAYANHDGDSAQGIVRAILDAVLPVATSHLRAEIDRLTAGADPTPRDPAAWPTPGQFIADWNTSAERRLELAQAAIGNAQAAVECITARHQARLLDSDQTLRNLAVLLERAHGPNELGLTAGLQRLIQQRDDLRAAAQGYRDDRDELQRTITRQMTRIGEHKANIDQLVAERDQLRDRLEAEQADHVIQIADDDWTIEHPASCFRHDCAIDWAERDPQFAASLPTPGRYTCTLDADQRIDIGPAVTP